VVVIGAGAWGLPAAAELAHRGHDVTLIDRHGVGNLLSSSAGPTRLWRLSHPDTVRVRLAQRSVAAMDRLASRSGVEVRLRRGLLWRDAETVPAVGNALAEAGVDCTHVDPADVGRFFPGLRPDHRPAIWQLDAGPLLAAESLTAQAALFVADGGVLEVGPVIREIVRTPEGVRVVDANGSTRNADVVVLAPGPGAAPLLATLGLDLPLRPNLEQVVHFGNGHPDGTDQLPCLYDGPLGAQPGLYAMPTPGRGYKIGMDRPLRDWTEGDDDRTPDAALVGTLTERVRRDLGAVPPTPIDAQVCSWTDSPDGRFVIDTLPGGIVIACGDSGEGFKFSALMGILLADLAEGRTPDSDVATFALSRFEPGAGVAPHVLGR
jgi:sarcosine oxidase